MLRRLAALAVLPVLLVACETAPQADDVPAPVAADTAAARPLEAEVAVATLAALDSSGVTGRVEFRRIGETTEVRYSVEGLTPGEHGFHVHQNADCGADSTGEAGTAAGPHFNPLASPHGAPQAALTARHAGDFGNLIADETGRAEGILIDSVLTFDGPTALVGHAVIVHAGRDDLATQPGGDSGYRIACGVTAL
ncbi:MAG TPA: superoxide dismutase family protein [Rubricoccaceae bacterium]|jgi:Cu-Zn family superoxide dismutase